MAIITVEKGNIKDTGKKFDLGENPLLIGRQTPENNPDIALQDEYISRRHAEISFRQNSFMLRDLESTNGTTLDSIRLEPGKYYPLKPDSIIGLGISREGPHVLLRFIETRTFSTVRIDKNSKNESQQSGWIRIDEQRREIRVEDRQLTLSKKEYDLLLFLSRKMGEICLKDELIAGVWPEVANPEGVSDAAVDQLIHRLRLKIESDPAHPQHIISKKASVICWSRALFALV